MKADTWSRGWRILAVPVLALLAGCPGGEERVPTQALVLVRAEGDLVTSTRSVRITVRGGTGTVQEPVFDSSAPPVETPANFPNPIPVSVMPLGGDASRIYEVTVQATGDRDGESGVELATAKLISGFRLNRVVTTALVLRDRCTPQSPCVSIVEPGQLDDYSSDALTPVFPADDMDERDGQTDGAGQGGTIEDPEPSPPVQPPENDAGAGGSGAGEGVSTGDGTEPAPTGSDAGAGGDDVEVAPDAGGETDGSGTTDPVDSGTCETTTQRYDLPAFSRDKVDVLFMVDNSHSMLEEQQSLARELPEMLRALTSGDIDGDGSLEYPPVGELHVGVVSSDMGVAGGSVGASCAGVGDDGVLRSQGDPLDVDCAGQAYPHYLEFSPGDDTDTLGWNFSCVSRLGTDGCGLEQPLDAVLKALIPSEIQANTPDGLFCDPTLGPCPGTCGVPDMPCEFTATSPVGHGDGANEGFLQEDSVLAVIVVTDEDDCSVPDSAASLFDLSSEGPYAAIPINVRCYERSDVLHGLERYIQGLQGLRSLSPDRVVFAAITGVPLDLSEQELGAAEILGADEMQYRPDCSQVSPEPGCADDPICKAQCFGNGQVEPLPSCRGFNDDGSDRGKAFPPRRIVELAQRFGDGGLVRSICQEDYGPSLDAIVSKVAARLLGSCLSASVVPSGVLSHDGTGLVHCDLIEMVSPSIGCQRPGRSLAAEQPASGSLVSCLVDQVAVRQDSASSEPAMRLVPNPVNSAVTGWYYDNFSATAESSCGANGDVQRIAFTQDALLPAGASLSLACVTPCADDETVVSDPPSNLACGAYECASQSTPLGTLAACCAGDDAGRCGLDTDLLAPVGLPGGCVERDQPGEPGCFPIDVEVPDLGTLSLQGCCRPDGTCGAVLDDLLGVVELDLGCVSTAELGITEAPPDLGIAPEDGWPVSCEVGNMIAAGGGGADSDGGTDSAAGGDDMGGDDMGGDDMGGEAELTKTCSEAYTCATGCGGDDVCAAACGEGTDAESGALLAAIGTCLGTACPVDPATQMQDLFGCVVPAVGDGGACEGAIDACNADAP